MTIIEFTVFTELPNLELSDKVYSPALDNNLNLNGT